MPRALPLTDEMRSAFGPPSGVRRLGSSPRSRVWAADLGGTPVVVKQAVGGDAGARFTRETAALGVAARAAHRVAAPLLAADEPSRVMVLGRVTPSAPAADWPVAYAEALARLHAAGRPADAERLPVWTGPVEADAESFAGFARALGVPVSRAARAELSGAVSRLAADAAGHHALLHGDPCPGNDLYTPDGPVFVEFEQAALGSGAVELAYLRVGFPTCWGAMALPAATIAAAEAGYAAAWHCLTGAPVPGDPADAALGWLIRGDALVPCARRATTDHLARATRRDWRWGAPSARERLLHRLGAVSRLTADHPALSAVGALTASLATAAATRWPRLSPLPSGRDPRADP